jgi:hypothetical protein
MVKKEYKKSTCFKMESSSSTSAGTTSGMTYFLYFLVFCIIVGGIGTGIYFFMKKKKDDDKCTSVDVTNKCVDNSGKEYNATCNKSDGTLSCSDASACLISSKPANCSSTTCQTDHTWSACKGWKHSCNGKEIQSDDIDKCIQSGKMPICTKDKGFQCSKYELTDLISKAKEMKQEIQCPLGNLIWYTLPKGSGITAEKAFGTSPRFMSQSTMIPSQPIDTTNLKVYFPKSSTEKHYIFMIYYFGEVTVLTSPQFIFDTDLVTRLDALWDWSNSVGTPTSSGNNTTTLTFHAGFAVKPNVDAYIELSADGQYPTNCFGDIKIIQIPSTFTSSTS